MWASSKGEAAITQVSGNVELVEAASAVRPATTNEKVGDGSGLRTAGNSRAELTFADSTIARLGSETGLTLKHGARDLELSSGAVLVQVPKSAREAKVLSPSVNVALGGATVVFEAQPKIFKLLVLEGTVRLYRPRHLGDSILVKAGQMVFGNPNAPLGDPVDFDLGHFVKTCRFLTDFLPLHSEKLMTSESDRQTREKSKKNLVDTNLVIFGGGSVALLINPGQMGLLDQARGVSAAPMPSTIPASDDLGQVETLATSTAAPSPTQ